MTPVSEEATPLVALDLDGTLVNGNTLHIYIRCGLRQMLRHGHFLRLVRTLGLLAARKAGLISHADMKFGVFALIADEESIRDIFAKTVKARINETVAARVDAFRTSGYRILLATAAPAQYIPLIWKGDFVATDMDKANNPARIECRGHEKLNRVLEYASHEHLSLHTAITDDPLDDAPLLKAAKETILVKKDSQTLKIQN